MSTISRPRGPLPPRVYWTRRLLVASLALLLVFGIGSALSALTNGSSSAKDTAQGKVKQSAAKLSVTPTVAAKQPKTRLTKRERRLARQRAKASASAKASATAQPVLAEPDGPCSPSDVTISPYVAQAIAWHDSSFVLELKTKEAAACTWRASAESLTVRVTDKLGEIWATRQCPRAISTQDLVLRNDQPTTISIVWSGRRSDSTCSDTTRWARPGWYRVEVAAFGGEPGQILFELQRPKAVLVSPAASPTSSASLAPGETRPTDAPTGKPSGAVEP